MENETEEQGSGKAFRQFVLNLDDEDRELLERLSVKEKFTRSDILRIALRRYAKELGLENKPAA